MLSSSTTGEQEESSTTMDNVDMDRYVNQSGWWVFAWKAELIHNKVMCIGYASRPSTELLGKGLLRQER